MAFEHLLKAGQLAGSLVIPPKPKALGVILPGSGPTDRNGNGPNNLGLHTDAYRKLALGLAEARIASFRADKRGIGASGGEGNAVTLDDYVADCGSWLQLLATSKAANDFPSLPVGLPIWLIGHSEGGIIAMSAAKRLLVHGVVLLCCPGRPLGKVLIEQLSSDSQNLPHVAEVESVLNSLERGQRADVAHLPPQLAGLFHPSVQRFWASLLKNKPDDLIAALSCPILIIGGGKDLQVPAIDSRRLASHAQQPLVRIFSEMNHVLTDVLSNVRQDNLSTYTNPALPLSPELLPMIAQFILKRL